MPMDPEKKERLLREAAKPENQERKFKGYSPVGVSTDGQDSTQVAVKRLGKAAAEGRSPQQQASRSLGVDWGDIPDLKKRTEAQKVESMAARLWDAVAKRNYVDIENISRMLAAEGWKQGQPITYEDVTRIVVEQLRLAEMKMRYEKKAAK